MKTTRSSRGTSAAWMVTTALAISAGAFAQEPAGEAQAGVAVPAGQGLSAEELEKLLGPIALYPDTLLANVLAASVYPEEVKQAADFVKTQRKPEEIDAKPWEAPVKAIAKIPDAIQMMGEYADWTAALGQAYVLQAQDVMAAVQSLRKQAQEKGLLVSTPEQTVTSEGDTIVIVPAQPDVIYVPSYNPVYIYDPYPHDEAAAAFFGFTVGVIIGAAWCDLDCDWHGGCIGWGHSDVDIDINNDIDIDNINIGDRDTNIGQEGNAWKPNKEKLAQQPRADALQQFKGANGPGKVAQPRPATRASGGASDRAKTASRAPATNAPSSRVPANAPESRDRAAAARPAAPAARPDVPPQRATPRIPPQAPSQNRQSAFTGGQGSRASSQRGAASRGAAGMRGGGGRGGGRRG